MRGEGTGSLGGQMLSEYMEAVPLQGRRVVSGGNVAGTMVEAVRQHMVTRQREVERRLGLDG